jgi:hypothetical protein
LQLSRLKGENALKGLGNIAFFLSLIAGILILINGILWFADSTLFDNLGLGGFRTSLTGFFNMLGSNPPPPSLLGGMAILCAIIVFIGAYYVHMPAAYEMVGGILVLVLSIISLTTGGGFIVGAILGMIGGILGMARTRESVEEAVVKPKDQEEHERF